MENPLPQKTYSPSHQKYYNSKKDEINERRREYAREHQRLYNALKRQKQLESGIPKNPRGRPKKLSEVEGV
jgi:hypothetical protein